MAIIEATSFNKLPGYLVISRVTKTAQNDGVVLPFPGVLPLKAALATGGAETIVYQTLAVNNLATAYDDETREIAYDTGTGGARAAGGFYVKTSSGEILLVSSDSGAAGTEGTLTIAKRGCFGTTPSATGLANDDVLYVLSSLKLTGEGTGGVDLVYLSLPEDPSVLLY